jgi:catechol 2,3-dioxygenase-like lactoylglutathione lyase family enzyme
VSLRLELFTDSLSASLDFYGRVLGFEKEAEHGGGYTPHARGSARIALNLLSDLSESHPLRPVGRERPGLRVEMPVLIRPETTSDHVAIRSLTARAFARLLFSDGAELHAALSA